MSNVDTNITFLGVKLQYSEVVLTPRLETEMLVLWTLQRAGDFDICIDVGTGSGAIALSIANATSGRDTPPIIHAFDLSESALAIAEKNALSTGFWINFRRGDLLAPLLDDSALMATMRNKSILIIANLPYIPEDTILPTDVMHDDPALALWGWKNGTELTIRLIEQVKTISQTCQVSLACELFEDQASALSLQYVHQMNSTVSWNDQCGIERFILLTFPHATP